MAEPGRVAGALNPAGPPVRRDGFTLRGTAVTRLEAFVDAAVAFAVTLLVISIDAIPQSIADLLEALKAVPAFGVSFAMICMFWAAHARWSRRYGLDDTPTTLLSLVLVFLILVYVYPLKITFGMFFVWITDGWLASPLKEVRGADDIQVMFLVYATAFVSLSVCLGGLYLHAWRRRDALALDEHERIATCGEIAVYLWFVLVGASSALWSWRLMGRPATFSTGMPGMLYALLGLTGVADALGRRWARRLVNRPAQRVQGGMDAG